MNDEELTSLAAKAFGNAPDTFSPLTDDGDALRLVVALRLCVMRHEDGSTASSPDGKIIVDEGDSGNCNNPFAATRRAIVQAAAEIGRTMK